MANDTFDAQALREADEATLREMEVPWLKTPDELIAYIEALADRSHDYGTCVYAMSMAAVAAFNHVASKLGVTGFQASCADMDVLRRTRHMERFTITDISNALYPQYDLVGRLQETLAEAAPWLAEKARENLAQSRDHAHPGVIEHWRKLAEAA